MKKARRNILAVIFAAIAIIASVFYGNTNQENKNEKANVIVNSETSTKQETNESIKDTTNSEQAIDYQFRNEKLLQSHYDKHGKEMGFQSTLEYENGANAVIQNPNSLHKTEKEDGDDVYYLEETNEFVVVSTDGYIRTYFYPNDGLAYFNRQ